jgi:hypothetical protein
MKQEPGRRQPGIPGVQAGEDVNCTQGMDRGLVQPGSAVEFCTTMGGGGRSPHTHMALIALFRAMQLDNEENPIEDGANS